MNSEIDRYIGNLEEILKSDNVEALVRTVKEDMGKIKGKGVATSYFQGYVSIVQKENNKEADEYNKRVLQDDEIAYAAAEYEALLVFYDVLDAFPIEDNTHKLWQKVLPQLYTQQGKLVEDKKSINY